MLQHRRVHSCNCLHALHHVPRSTDLRWNSVRMLLELLDDLRKLSAKEGSCMHQWLLCTLDYHPSVPTHTPLRRGCIPTEHLLRHPADVSPLIRLLRQSVKLHLQSMLPLLHREVWV